MKTSYATKKQNEIIALPYYSKAVALQMSDSAIGFRAYAVGDIADCPPEVAEQSVAAARGQYAAEHRAGLFVPRIKKELSRWCSGKGKLPAPDALRFLAAVAAIEEIQ